jgi:asparagine synthase (glutamine-hydrolysing)
MGAVRAVFARAGRPDRRAVDLMHAAAPHRGTDGEVLELGDCMLCVSADSERREAWLAAGDGLAVAFAGALDNLADLAREVEAAGTHPVPRDPADVVRGLFRIFGEDTPRRLRGTFAVIVTNGSRLWAFRDHLGFKTLFYRDAPDALYVASEAKQVVAGAGLPCEPDPEVVERIFYGRVDDDTPCALKGVRRLRKATILSAGREGTATTSAYWNPDRLLETARPSETEVRERFEALMTQAVERMMTGEDVVSLSGGIDSPAVAAFAAPAHLRRTGRPLPALSAVFPDLPAVDERGYIEMIAGYLKMPLHTYQPAARPLDRVQEWVRRCDGPVPTVSIPDIEENYRLARRLGFRTILTGELGEFVYDMPRYALTHLLWHGRFGPVRAQVAAERARGTSWGRIARRFTPALLPGAVASAYVRLRGLDRGPRIPDWLDARKVNEVPYFTDLGTPLRERWRQQQMLAFIGPGISLEADEVCATLCGVRVRRPLADVDLWEFFLSLPAEIKFPDRYSKTLIRRLLRGRLPDAILDRTDKTVFNDSLLSRIDYAEMRRWLIDPQYRVAGVKYDVLAERLRREDFVLVDYIWARDLTGAHAFLSLW